MRLRSPARQKVRIADLDMEVTFADGEDLLTEISAKFTPQGSPPSWRRPTSWSTPVGRRRGEFLLTLAHPYC